MYVSIFQFHCEYYAFHVTGFDGHSQMFRENGSKICSSSYEDDVKLIYLIVRVSVRAESGIQQWSYVYQKLMSTKVVKTTSEGKGKSSVVSLCLIGIASLSKAPYILNNT